MARLPLLASTATPVQRLAMLMLVVAAGLAGASLVIVPETETALVLRFGEPVRQSAAGIAWRLPFVEQVVRVDKRLIDVDLDRVQLTTADQQRLELDADARVRISDPVRMIQTAGTPDRLVEQLQPILDSVLRQELGQRGLAGVIAAERGPAMARVRASFDREARDYGVSVIDVRLKRVDLPEGAPLDAALARMVSAGQQEAAAIRAEGQKDAQIIRADAEGRAARTYAQSFGKDPQFYDFYRAMQSYDTTFAQKGSKTGIVLGPENAWLRQFRGPEPGK